MNTQVKVGIAAAIIAALVAIIVVDQRSSQGTRTAQASPAHENGPAPDQQTGIVLHRSEQTPDPQGGVVTRGREELDRTTAGIVKGAQPEIVGPGIKGQDLPVAAVPDAPAETYEVQQGDTMYIIAEKKYGDGNLYPLIAKANSKVNPGKLRVGQKLLIPARNASPAAPVAPAEGPVTEEGGQKTDMVQAGDTLGDIAKRVYSTARRSVIDRIIAANPGIDVDGVNLRVGAKLTLPAIEVSTTPRIEGPVAETSFKAPTTGRTYKVVANDSLWKIAAKFRGTSSTSEMMEKIVAANGDLLHSTGDGLKVDWVLVIPD